MRNATEGKVCRAFEEVERESGHIRCRFVQRYSSNSYAPEKNGGGTRVGMGRVSCLGTITFSSNIHPSSMQNPGIACYNNVTQILPNNFYFFQRSRVSDFGLGIINFFTNTNPRQNGTPQSDCQIVEKTHASLVAGHLKQLEIECERHLSGALERFPFVLAQVSATSEQSLASFNVQQGNFFSFALSFNKIIAVARNKIISATTIQRESGRTCAMFSMLPNLAAEWTSQSHSHSKTLFAVTPMPCFTHPKSNCKKRLK